jgi:hypothetical protein
MGERQAMNDLFGERPVRLPRNPIALAAEPPELKAAKALAAQMGKKRSRRDKKQVAHLICLNLISMLKHRPKKVGSESTFR